MLAVLAVAPSAVAGVRLAGGGQPGSQRWVSRYDGPGHLRDVAQAVAVSPDGRTVFVTGPSSGQPDPVGRLDYGTVAYDAATGARRWVSRYDFGGNDQATSVAVSPDGFTVFVTGASKGTGPGLISNYDYATVAYKASTGAQLWASRYDGAGRDDLAAAVVTGRDRGTVHVTGSSLGMASGWDYATVAYNPATGAQLWASRYNGPGNGDDRASALAVSQGGGTVYVTGGSRAERTGADYATVAYNAATGTRRWDSRYNGRANLTDSAAALAVGPHGETVFVTGRSKGANSDYDFATVAYRAATGEQRWVRRYNGRHNRSDRPAGIAVSPRNGTVFVLGTSISATTGRDYATAAYGATGALRWVSRFNSAAHCDDYAAAVAAGPAGGRVFVTGSAQGATCRSGTATIAYSAATGVPAWTTRSVRGRSVRALTAGPRGRTLYLAGRGGTDYLTVAYRA
jgi:hypothetical protein